MHALFVFAHQDDELAAAARILYLLRSGATVTVVFLTNGSTERATPEERDAESRKALRKFGVDRILFIGSECGIPDGRLIEFAPVVLDVLEQRAPAVDEVWCLAWEGGHQDHDASHLIAVAFAEKRGVDCFEVPLYHGHRTRFFRVMAPLTTGAPWSTRDVSAREGLRIALASRHYRSQWKTWIGLLPEALWRALFVRKEWSRCADPTRLDAPPHERPLLYERMVRTSWEAFAEHAARFRRRREPR